MRSLAPSPRIQSCIGAAAGPGAFVIWQMTPAPLLTHSWPPAHLCMASHELASNQNWAITFACEPVYMLIKMHLFTSWEWWRGHVCACVMKHRHACESVYMSEYLYDLMSTGAGIYFCILYVFKYLHVDWCVFYVYFLCVFTLYLCVVQMADLPVM